MLELQMLNSQSEALKCTISKQNCKHVRKTLAIICSSLLGLVLSFTRTDRYMEISYSIKTQVQVIHLKNEKSYNAMEKLKMLRFRYD